MDVELLGQQDGEIRREVLHLRGRCAVHVHRGSIVFQLGRVMEQAQIFRVPAVVRVNNFPVLLPIYVVVPRVGDRLGIPEAE